MQWNAKQDVDYDKSIYLQRVTSVPKMLYLWFVVGIRIFSVNCYLSLNLTKGLLISNKENISTSFGEHPSHDNQLHDDISSEFQLGTQSDCSLHCYVLSAFVPSFGLCCFIITPKNSQFFSKTIENIVAGILQLII